RLMPLLRDRALAEGSAGEAKLAVADGDRALALGIAAWGPDYPDIATTRRALGLLYIEQLGDIERGETEIAQALRQFSARFGADSAQVANSEQALSKALQLRGEYARALVHAERAEQIYARQSGTDHMRHGEALMGVGALRFLRKDFTGSLAADEAAYPILATALGASHPTVALLESNTGETLLALGRPEAAQGAFQRALDILRAARGPDHEDLAFPLKGLGLAHLGRGQLLEAVAPLERALALSSRAASDPQELAEIRWALARTLHALGRDPARARELATAALAGYRELGSESTDRVQEISRWLTTAPGTSGTK
ncbi:MAG TPA: tetratricopeptide repeat protein, partial [Kofleriaceae bacterium]